jgi:aldose 1-epimerase
MSITATPFGMTADDEPVTKYTLTNRHGHRVSLTNWGASILEVEVPDLAGKRANVNLVFDSLERYLGPHPGFGSTIGRFCNRIAHGKFSIDGTPYQIPTKGAKHALHGGVVNFSHHLWNVEVSDEQNPGEDCVTFILVRPDGDEGFPGEVVVEAAYRWNDDNELIIEYSATTTKPTHINLTNHSYWNLGGVDSGTVLDHEAIIHADEILDVDADLIPTGKILRVDNTPFDFRKSTPLAQRIAALSATKGYDHCYVLQGEPGELRLAARVTDPQSGRILEVETTQPGMQLYTGNHLKGTDATAGYGPHDAFCLETQHYPDAPNHPHFPTTLLRPNETFRETTVYRFTL